MVKDVEQYVQDKISVLNKNVQSQDIVNDIAITDVETDEKIAKLLSENEEITDEDTLDLMLDLNYEHNTKLLEAISSQMNVHGESMWNITGLNCAVHTLQLVIRNAIKSLNLTHRNVIDLCRRVIIFLRLKSSHYEMNIEGMPYSQLRLDVETRWCSTFNMVRIHIMLISFNFFLS